MGGELLLAGDGWRACIQLGGEGLEQRECYSNEKGDRDRDRDRETDMTQIHGQGQKQGHAQSQRDSHGDRDSNLSAQNAGGLAVCLSGRSGETGERDNYKEAEMVGLRSTNELFSAVSRLYFHYLLCCHRRFSIKSAMWPRWKYHHTSAQMFPSFKVVYLMTSVEWQHASDWRVHRCESENSW